MAMPLRAPTFSRIGKGRLAASESAPNTDILATTASAATPDAVKTAPSGDQHARSLSHSGHNLTTPVINISPDQTPAEQQQPSMQSSKWGKSTASEGGPVFQVVSRGSRVATGAPSSYTPPSHPTKTHATAPRTRSLAPSRSTPSSSSSNASISLRNRTASSTSSTVSSGMAFGSKIDRPTGRLPTDSATKACSTPPAAANCKSVVRVLSFEESTNSPAGSPAVQKPGFCPATGAAASTAAAATTALPNCSPAGTAAAAAGPSSTTSDSGIGDANPPNQSSNNSSRIPMPFLSVSSVAAQLLDAEQSLAGRPTAAALRVGFGPLPDVHDADSAAAAARVLLQQLLDSASSITSAAGLSAGSLNVEAPSAAGTDSSTGSDGSTGHEQRAAVGESTSSSSNSGKEDFAVLIAKAAVMLEAGCRADVVRQAVLPALLLQLAAMTCNHNDSNLVTAADGLGTVQAETGAAAAAAGALRASVQAGVVAAQASLLQGGTKVPAAGADTKNDVAAAAEGAGMREGPDARILVVNSSSKSLGRRVLGACLLVFGCLVLLAVGFTVAIAWTVVDSSSEWAADSSVADVLQSNSGVEWPVEWLFDGSADTAAWGGAVLAGRRFVP